MHWIGHHLMYNKRKAIFDVVEVERRRQEYAYTTESLHQQYHAYRAAVLENKRLKREQLAEEMRELEAERARAERFERENLLDQEIGPWDKFMVNANMGLFQFNAPEGHEDVDGQSWLKKMESYIWWEILESLNMIKELVIMIVDQD